MHSCDKQPLERASLAVPHVTVHNQALVFDDRYSKAQKIEIFMFLFGSFSSEARREHTKLSPQ